MVTWTPESRVGKRPGPKPRLDRDAIVHAAIKVGADQLSIAAVAESLGVAPASLYRYIDGLEDLAVAAVERLFASTPLPSADGGWHAFLEAEAGIRWALLMRYSGLIGQGGASLATVAIARFEAIVRTLTGAGFTLHAALLAADSVLDLVHDAVTQVLSFRDTTHPSGLTKARRDLLALYSDDVRAELLSIMDEPWKHLQRKLALVLDGVAVQLQ